MRGKRGKIEINKIQPLVQTKAGDNRIGKEGLRF